MVGASVFAALPSPSHSTRINSYSLKFNLINFGAYLVLLLIFTRLVRIWGQEDDEEEEEEEEEEGNGS